MYSVSQARPKSKVVPGRIAHYYRSTQATEDTAPRKQQILHVSSLESAVCTRQHQGTIRKQYGIRDVMLAARTVASTFAEADHINAGQLSLHIQLSVSRGGHAGYTFLLQSV